MIDFKALREVPKTNTHISHKQYLETLNLIEKEIVPGSVVQGKVYKPQEVVKYDVVSSFVCNMPHPCLVYKTDKDFVYAISMSSKDRPHSLFKLEKSRIYGGSFLTITVLRIPKAEALQNFIGIYDARKEADDAIKAVRKFYCDLFKI